jgi:lysyl-tRNA synthetase class 2
VPLQLHEPSGEAHNYLLITSPEIALKKMLVAGWNKLFQLAPVFRDYEEFGHTHNPEFTMLEWYRAPGSMEDIMDDIEHLFKDVANKLGVKNLVYNGKDSVVSESWGRLTMKEVWQKYLGVNLDDYLDSDSLCQLAESRGYSIEDGESYENIFYKIFLNEIEGKLGVGKPILIYNYPGKMPAFCQYNTTDPRYVERFELYINGLELANGYGELVDPVEQEKRLKDNQEFRKNAGSPVYLYDEDFIAALKSGLPPAGGVALGVERLVMLLTGAKNINEIIFESASDQSLKL